MNGYSIQQAINDSVMPKEGDKHPKNSWYPTDMGKCLRGVYLARKGVEAYREVDVRMQRVFQCGHMFEAFVIAKVKEHADKNNYTIESQKRILIPELDVTGYLDLKVTTPKESIIYDVKTKNSNAFWYMNKYNKGPDRHYLEQVWTYLKAENVQRGAVFYVSKDDLTLLEYPVRLDDETLATSVMGQLKLLNDCWKNDVLPPMAENIVIGDDGKPTLNWQARYCNWHATCTGDIDWEKKAKAEVLRMKGKTVIKL